MSELEQFNNEELFNRFKVIYDANENDVINRSDLSEFFGVKLTKDGLLNNQNTKNSREMRKYMIDYIRIKPLPAPPPVPKLKPYIPPKVPKLAPYIPPPVPILTPYIPPSPPTLKPYYKTEKYIKQHDNELFKRIKDKVQSYKRVEFEDELAKLKRESFMKTYTEYKNQDDEKQDEMIKDLEEKLFNTDTKEWLIDFEQYNDYGRKKLFPILKKWFDEVISKISMGEKFKFCFKVGEQWRALPFNQELFNKLSDSLKDGCLIYNMDKYNPENAFNSDQSIDTLPEWSIFSAIHICKIKHNENVKKDNGGHFFKYLIDPLSPEAVKIQLVRYQIFESLNNRKELNDCCFIYALKQTGKFTEEELNVMRLRIKSRYLSQGNIKKICDEFKIKIIIFKINDDTECKNKKRKVINNDHNFIGYENATPDRTFTFCLYEDHYYLYERTPFTTDYINNIDIAPIDATNKRCRKNKDGSLSWKAVNPDKEQSHFMMSDKLIISLMKQNKFIPINYATASILSTTLYDKVKNKDYPLDITDKSKCFQKIAPRNKPKTKEVPKSYWYSDFEADTSGEVHKPFLNVTQSSDGKINKVFTGDKCAIEFLNFLPDNAVVYFHNLAYDWCMFNRNVKRIKKVIKKGSKSSL